MSNENIVLINETQAHSIVADSKDRHEVLDSMASSLSMSVKRSLSDDQVFFGGGKDVEGEASRESKECFHSYQKTKSPSLALLEEKKTEDTDRRTNISGFGFFEPPRGSTSSLGDVALSTRRSVCNSTTSNGSHVNGIINPDRAGHRVQEAKVEKMNVDSDSNMGENDDDHKANDFTPQSSVLSSFAATASVAESDNCDGNALHHTEPQRNTLTQRTDEVPAGSPYTNSVLNAIDVQKVQAYTSKALDDDTSRELPPEQCEEPAGFQISHLEASIYRGALIERYDRVTIESEARKDQTTGVDSRTSSKPTMITELKDEQSAATSDHKQNRICEQQMKHMHVQGEHEREHESLKMEQFVTDEAHPETNSRANYISQPQGLTESGHVEVGADRLGQEQKSKSNGEERGSCTSQHRDQSHNYAEETTALAQQKEILEGRSHSSHEGESNDEDAKDILTPIIRNSKKAPTQDQTTFSHMHEELSAINEHASSPDMSATQSLDEQTKDEYLYLRNSRTKNVSDVMDLSGGASYKSVESSPTELGKPPHPDSRMHVQQSGQPPPLPPFQKPRIINPDGYAHPLSQAYAASPTQQKIHAASPVQHPSYSASPAYSASPGQHHQTAFLPPMSSMMSAPPLASMMSGPAFTSAGKRRLYLRLQEDVLRSSMHLKKPKHSRMRSAFFSSNDEDKFATRKPRSFFFRGSSTKKMLRMGDDSADDYAVGKMELPHPDRGTLNVSWYEGTSSAELQDHVRNRVIRKLNLNGDVELAEMRILDDSVDPPEEICLSPFIPDGSNFLLRYSTKSKTEVKVSEPATYYGPPDSPSAAPSPYPQNLGLDAKQLNLLKAQLDALKTPGGNHSSEGRKNRDVSTPTSDDEQDHIDSPNSKDAKKTPEFTRKDSEASLYPENSIEARLNQITKLLLLDQEKKIRPHPPPVTKRQVIFVLANYFVLFISMVTIMAELQARAPKWQEWMETQLDSVHHCAADQEALFKCVSNGDFAGLIASVALWITRSAATKRIFLFGFETPKKLWNVVYESLVTAVCWGFSYMFIRRGMNPDTRENFLQKYYKDCLYGSMAGFNAAFMKQVLKNLIPQEALEEVINERHMKLKILNWLPNYS